MNRAARLGQASPKGAIALAAARPCVATLVLVLLACSSPPGSKDGTPPIRVEYRLASFSRSSLQTSLEGIGRSDCLAGEESESLEFVYPNGRRMPVEVALEPGFTLDVWQAEVALQEMPIEDGLQVAALVELTIDERRMKQARKFRAKHQGCELVVLVEGEVADLLVAVRPWKDGLPGGRFATLDEARAIYQRPGMSITIVPEALEVTRWRRQFRQWQAYQARWRFRCDPAYREVMKRRYPDTYARLQEEDRFFAVLSCDEPPRPPPHPGR
jgi:hypothetical protein